MKKVDLEALKPGETPSQEQVDSVAELAKLINSQLAAGVLFYTILVKPNGKGFLVRQMCNFNNPEFACFMLEKSMLTEMTGMGRIHTEMVDAKQTTN